MAIPSRLHRLVGKPETQTPEDEPTVIQLRAGDKEAGPVNDTIPDDKPTEDAQTGVKKIEAVTLTWGRGSMFMVLVFIWFLTLVNNMKSSMVYSLTAYATSSFAGHSLLTVVNIVSSAMAGAVYIPMAKALDLWGRAEGFLLMVGMSILGIVLLASSNNLPTYCAGEVFYSVGFGGLAYSWDVLAADVTNLRNRGLAFAFTSSPALISAFAGSKAAAEFLLHVNWRWGYGMWAIVLPAFALPLYGLLAYNLRRAERQGTITRERTKPVFNLETIWWVIVEFDCELSCSLRF
ncbi:unnamed protein product [Penicillium salamii]|uniref:Major facilitator superfamily (MFS) profile domain-containing protein n=1 Tax=Penicillium salamii TaxID=1612424 RepID=A0A9W4JN04_9EURO|nr:unnamed protein product [Penicillium salamii]CAG8102930.1 unnamed protein product [Penicillium salamii]CAG8145394.1 unnamed protein product [Penicillium salamii]CAG8180529.1 unnamed protein product [Penicillium salamii]CAG8239369.1 unnamed protein product [Penicillium salamii]